MPVNRFYSPHELELEKQLDLEGKEFHHLAHVTGTRKGDTVELVNGTGVLTKARVAELSKRKATLEVFSIEAKEGPSFPLIVAQAIPRANRLDCILEKGSELGMTEIWLFPGYWSESKALPGRREERIQQVLIAAMKQCGRLHLPIVRYLPPLENSKDWPEIPQPSFFGSLNPKAPPLLSCQESWLKGKSALFFIGPERGFSEEEETVFSKWGAQGVKLHQNILRTDTAPLVALSVVSHSLLD